MIERKRGDIGRGDKGCEKEDETSISGERSWAMPLVGPSTYSKIEARSTLPSDGCS